MKKIVAICPTLRDKKELSNQKIMRDYEIVWHQHDSSQLERIICHGIGWLSESFDPGLVIDEMIALSERNNINGVLSSEDYPGSIFASIVGSALGLPSPSVESVLTCQHKYLSRKAQHEYVPEATPRFDLISINAFDIKKFSLSFPCFIKPVKAFFSVFAHAVYDQKELAQLITSSQLPAQFLQQFDYFLNNYSKSTLDSHYLIAEELLQGEQVTLEGFVYQGVVTIMGVVDSIMFPGTISFKRFDYPSCLPESIQERMATIAQKFMHGIGFDNGMFNIEYMYNPKTDKIDIIEVNPRMASQFADLYEKVDGINSYEILAAIAVGNQPILAKNKGEHKAASSLVFRLFEDKKVVSVPSQQDIDLFYQQFPDARLQIFVEPGQKLSDTFQDGKSFRYGLVHLGGRDLQEILHKFQQAQELLPFKWASV